MRDSSNRKKERHHYFYEYFIDLDNLKKLGDENLYLKLFWWDFVMSFTTLVSVALATEFGLSVADMIWRFFLVVIIINQKISIKCYLKMEELFLYFHIFKKQWMGIIFPGLPLFLSIAFTLLPIWVPPVFTYPDIINFGSNLIFVGCIYIPLYLIFQIFNNYAYQKIIKTLPQKKGVLAYRYSVRDDMKNNVNDKPTKRNIRLK